MSETGGMPRRGYLAGLAAEERRRRQRERRPASGGVSSLTERARVWARMVGFDERLVVAAAGEALNVRVLTRGPVTKALVLARLERTRPELFGGEAT